MGNVLPYNCSDFDKVKHLTWKRVVSNDSGVIVSLKVTKTIQNFERDVRIPISESLERPEFCVKKGLQDMLRVARLPQI